MPSGDNAGGASEKEGGRRPQSRLPPEHAPQLEARGCGQEADREVQEDDVEAAEGDEHVSEASRRVHEDTDCLQAADWVQRSPMPSGVFRSRRRHYGTTSQGH